MNIIALAKNVHATLGPGFAECIYHRALEAELRKNNIPYESERIVPISYEGMSIGHVRLDIVVNGEMILELKAVAKLSPDHELQIRNYLKLVHGVTRGILINFGKEMTALEFEPESFALSPPP